MVLLVGLISCDGESESEGYFFEDDYEEEEYAENQIPEEVVIQNATEGESVNLDEMPDVNRDSILDSQDQEPEAKTIKDIIELVLTDGKIDTAKVTYAIINTLKYVAKEPLGASFACERIAYFGTNIMLPIPKNENSASLYLAREFNGKRYHFIVLNFRGYVTGKNYVVECSRNDFNYKELFVFYPSGDYETQASMLMAITDDNLTDIETMLNINWRTGEEAAAEQNYGVVQYMLSKKIPS